MNTPPAGPSVGIGIEPCRRFTYVRGGDGDLPLSLAETV